MTEQAKSVVTRDEPQLSRPRLPYPARVEEIFGVSRASWRFLTDVLYPNAEEPETVINVLAYCQARKLDVMKKPVHVVPVWDKKRKKMVDSVWPSIAEVRITAMRTGEYVGKGETIFGPEVTETLGGVEITYPKFAQLTVYRLVAGVAREFHGEKLLWKEFYAKAGRETLAPNDMWKTKPFKQLAKCAEADALRAAFPEETGSDPTAEEMHGQEVEATITSERVSGPNLQSRLSGGVSASQGLDAAGLASIDERPEPSAKGGSVQEPAIDAEIEEIQPIAKAEAPPPNDTTETLHDPETGQVIGDAAGELLPAATTSPEPPKARDEINGPAPMGVVYMLAGDPVSDAGRVPTYKDGEKHSTCGAKGAADLARYTMHPTPKAADDGPIPADDADDGFPGDKPAPTTSDAVEKTDTVAEADDEEVWEPLERNDGPAPRGVEYTLSSDEIGDDGAQAYEDGEPTRIVALRDFMTLPEYDAHPEPLVEEEEPPEGTIFDALLNESTWDAVKKALPGIYKQMNDQGMNWDDQEAVRRQIWASVVVTHLGGVYKIEVKPTLDPSGFRLWMSTQAGPEGADIIDDVFAKLKASPAFQAMPADAQGRITEITTATCANLRAAG